MSLKLLAKQMEAKGRGGDSMLVHMTPGEVAGLQKLAESAGGSLTVNPETGLVEANFLKRMLPTLVGIGLGATGIGALGAAALVGGGTALATGDMKKGLMAGLGAAGGAGIGAGLSAAGGAAAAPGTAAATTATTPASAVTGAVPDAAGTVLPVPSGAPVAAPTPSLEGALPPADVAAATPTAAPTPSSAPAEMIANDGSRLVQNPDGTFTSFEGTDVVQAKQPMTFGQELKQDFAQAGRGIGRLGDEQGRAAFMKRVGGGSGLASDVGMAAISMQEPPKEREETPVDDEMIQYDFDAGYTGAERVADGGSSERRYFDGRFSAPRRIRAADYFSAKGGLISLAEGGDVAAPAGATADAMNYLMGSATGAAPSASEAGLAYLMGQTNQSPVMQSALARQNTISNFVAPERAKSTTSTTEGYKLIDEGPYKGLYQSESPVFAFDPTAQKYYRKDDVFEYIAPPPEQTQDSTSYGAAQGGLIGLAKGGMASGGFVVPADVVSMVGEGNTDAGYKRIKAMIPGATAIKGKDGGQADTVKTSIDGKQPARVAHGEMYIPPATVKRMGGAKKLYAMMDRVRAQATGSTKQIRPVSLKKAMA